MTIVDRPLDPPLACVCGCEVRTFSIGHGRTPYAINCRNCQLHLREIMPSGVGYSLGEEHAKEAWSDYVKAYETLRERLRRRPAQSELREFFYRRLKGWPDNP